MISTLAEDEDGDLFVTRKGPAQVYGAQAVVVLAKANLRQQPGEDFMLPARGHDYPALLGKGASPGAIRTNIAEALERVSGVTQVSRCNVTIVRQNVIVDVGGQTDQPSVPFSFALKL